MPQRRPRIQPATRHVLPKHQRMLSGRRVRRHEQQFARHFLVIYSLPIEVDFRYSTTCRNGGREVSAVRARMTSISTAVSRRPLDPLRDLRTAIERTELLARPISPFHSEFERPNFFQQACGRDSKPFF